MKRDSFQTRWMCPVAGKGGAMVGTAERAIRAFYLNLDQEMARRELD